MKKPTEFKRMEDLVKQVLAVPKAEIDKLEAEYKKARAKTAKGKKSR